MFDEAATFRTPWVKLSGLGRERLDYCLTNNSGGSVWSCRKRQGPVIQYQEKILALKDRVMTALTALSVAFTGGCYERAELSWRVPHGDGEATISGMLLSAVPGSATHHCDRFPCLCLQRWGACQAQQPNCTICLYNEQMQPLIYSLGSERPDHPPPPPTSLNCGAVERGYCSAEYSPTSW